MTLDVAALPPASAAYRAALTETPHAEALADDRQRFTYAQLDASVSAVSAGLAVMGVRPGDRVAASAANEVGLVVTFLATMRLGAVWVGISPALAPAEVEYQLADSGASLFVGNADRVRRPPVELRHWVADPGELAESGAGLDPPDVDIDRLAPAAIAYTSGTTGRPKGAVHSQHNMMVVATGAGGRAVPSGGDRVGVCLPLALLNLMILGPLTAFCARAACLLARRMDTVSLAGWALQERITTMAVVPTILHDLVTHPEVDAARLLGTLRPTVGGADCPPAWRRLFAGYGLDVNQTYGLTEAPTAVTAGEPGQPDGSAGRALPHIEITIRDLGGRPMPRGQAGEICVGPVHSGPLGGLYRPMLGYWNDRSASEAALRGEVLHTGDVGTLDDAGFLYLHDRGDDLILRGGANVYPAEVERVLAMHPGVTGAAVVGLPDERLGQRVAAAVETRRETTVTEAEIKALCAGELAAYKIPERVAIVGSLPRTSMGKVRRSEARSIFFPDSIPDRRTT